MGRRTTGQFEKTWGQDTQGVILLADEFRLYPLSNEKLGKGSDE